MTMTKDEQAVEPGPFGSPVAPGSARETVEQMVQAGLLDAVFDRVETGDVQLTGQGGLLPEMIKAVLERGLQGSTAVSQAELTDHLGYAKHQRGDGTNARNGTTPKALGLGP